VNVADSTNPTVRAAAAIAAAVLHSSSYVTTAGHVGAQIAIAAVRSTAEQLLPWIAGVTAIHLTTGPVVDQVTHLPTGTTITPGGPVQIHDNEQFSLTADPVDSKGVPLADVLTWTVDNDSVATLSVSPDTHTCTVVAGLPGSTIVTVSDGMLSATEAVDVIPGGVATIRITEGPVEPQPGA
jgi:hypothetical protein